MQFDKRPIAMLDSGVGGLSILREVRQQLPNEDVLYLADQGHVPYGPRHREQIRRFTHAITRFFLERRAKTIVVACNAASAASLYYLRETFPDIPFVGMEPAVKPAAEQTRNGVIGVITTEATYQGELFASVTERFTSGVDVVTQVCPEFVTLVEAGKFDTPETRKAARHYLQPLLDSGIDQLVLGCTHFPFLTPVLQDIIGPDIQIIDPSPAVARQTGRIIGKMRNAKDHPGQVSYFTTGDPAKFLTIVRELMDEPVFEQQVIPLKWLDDNTLLPA